MDKKKTFIVASAAVVCVLLGAILLSSRGDSTHGQANTGSSNLSEANSQRVPVKQEVTVNQQVGVSAQPVQISARVEADGRTVTATDKDGKIRWSVDVIAECGVPYVGAAVVRHVEVGADKVSVVFGKHSHASIDINTGKVKFLGTD